jgi:hypothetical protein
MYKRKIMGILKYGEDTHPQKHRLFKKEGL